MNIYLNEWSFQVKYFHWIWFKMASTLKQVVNQNLECPVCLSVFKDPKILSCSHTFCRGCLESFLECQPDDLKLSCPVCRKETLVADGDVSVLQTNITVKSLVEDVESQVQMCSNCDPEDNALAVIFCKDCGDYLCESCREMHSKWAKFSSHTTIPISDVRAGNVSMKRRSQCQKHPSEDEECFCLDCNEYVCFRCSVLEHAQVGHKVLEAAIHEAEQNTHIDELSSKATAKICQVENYIAYVTEQHGRLMKVEEELCLDIDEAFEETVQRLTKRKELLKRDVGQRVKRLDDVLIDMEQKGRQQIIQINAVCGLVNNGLKIPLQKDALTAHNTLCLEMEHVLSQVEHDEMKPRGTADEGVKLRFVRNLGSNGLDIGHIQGESRWVLHMESQLPIKNSMRGMAVSPGNTVDVGCWTGGIVTFSTDGILQEIVLNTVEVCSLQFTSDGGYVIRDYSNTISLYTPHCCKKLRVKFATLSDEEGGLGDLSVDRHGHILSSYRDTKMIQVFNPSGGKPIRDIQCQGFEPQQIFAMTAADMIVVKSDGHTVRVIDDTSGTTIHSITREGEDAYPTVCKDDYIAIAWVRYDQGLVNISRYTKELKHIQSIITDFKIMKSPRPWFYLQEFKTGELALCTPCKLFIFRQIQD